MAEHSVKLPEPRSDDSEDVVWGLSTASALWARGERKDAVVWIRRAAEAAEAAGNPFRASELGMYLPDLEKALLSPVVMAAEEPAPVSDAAPISSFEVVMDADTPAPPVVLPPLSIPSLGPIAPVAAPVAAQPPASAATPTTDPAAPTPPTMPPAQAAPTPPTMPPAQAAPTPPVVAAATSTTPTPASPTPAATNPTASSGRQTPIPAVPSSMANAPRASTPTPASLRPQTTVPRRSPSQVNIPAVAAAPRPASDSAVPARGSAVSPTPAAGTPVVAAPVAAAPVAAASAAVAPTPPAPPPEEPPSIDEGRSALPPPAPMPNVAPAPVAAAAPVVAAASTTSATPQPTTPSPVPAAPKAAGAAQKRRQVLRTPILDPWSEASVREVKSPRERRRQQNSGDGGAGAARHRARMLLDEEDDDVLTSAPLLADILGKKHLGGPTVGGTGLAQAPPAPAAGRTSGTPAAPPPLPPRVSNVPATGGRPPPLPPAVAAPTPAPPAVAMAGASSSKTPSQPPPATPAQSPSPSPVPAAAPTSAAAPTAAAAPTPAVSAAPTSAKNPTPAPPAPATPAPAKTPTTPPPAAAPLAPKVPTPPPPDEDEEDGSEAPRRLNSARVPTPAPETQQPPVPSQRAKPATDAPEQSPASDIVPTAPRPLPRHSPTIPPAPKLPTGALGKPPVAARPNPVGEDAAPSEEDEQRRKFTDTLPSGITMSALVQAEAEASRNAAAPPQTPAGTKPLFEITKKPGAAPAPAAPRIPTPAPRPATIAPKAPSMPPSAGGIKPPPPSVGAPPAPSAPTAKTRSSLPPPPTRESVAPPADPIRISNLELRGLEPFAHLPEEVQRTLVRTAIIEDVVPGESRSAFGAVLVVAGEVAVCAVNLNVPVKLAPARSFIASRGSLAEPVPMRIVGSLSGATISRWSTEIFEQAVNGHEQAVRDCRTASDSLQARIGLTLGALSEVELETRDAMLSRLDVRVLAPGEAITDEDGPMPGLVFVVGGSVEILEGDPPNVVSDVRPGELLFPEALWAGAPAPLRSRASAMGALLLMGDRKLALDFAENVPIVGELLSR